MAERDAHLVGTPPGATPAEAMRTTLEVLGPRLRSLPAATDDYAAFLEARAAAGRHDVAFQLSVPSDLTRAITSRGLVGALRSRRSDTLATLTRIREVAAITGPDTLFPIEVPAEMGLVAKAPRQVRPALARVLARPTIGLAAGSAPGTRFAVHLFVGDTDNRDLGRSSDVNPLVLLANTIVAGWPSGRPLDLVHVPFAAAGRPATTDPRYYRPLQSLRIPAGTRFCAGFADESQPFGDQRTILGIVEAHLDRDVVVATGSGLGRRTPEAGRAALERMAELCGS